ncbi:type I-E CRISPR-associated protein Cse2/CasB [Nocardiopsis listeri]|uniref:type I-E CRISPR-associated protein Cse2/CasB n=1 Tax=Nocardiopsis listeri TaxID=53440 RepID=UPI00082E6014|nr:type I-E CRISPR-associated protein Cse2/CasB [Nocardiopsis listeri]
MSSDIPLRERILWNADRMVERLNTQVVDEPAVRATLRRAMGKEVTDPVVLPVHGFVTPYLPDLSEKSEPHERYRFPEAAVERAFYTVAALIAGQTRQARDQGTGDEINSTEGGAPAADASGEKSERSRRKRRLNLGATLGKAVTKDLLNADTTEGRLHMLCRQSLEGAHKQLPLLALHLRGREMPIDWGLLTLDLARWGGDRDAVAKEWVQGYHRVIQAQDRARQSKSQNTDDDKDGA